MRKLLRLVLALSMGMSALAAVAPSAGTAAETEGTNSVYWSNAGGNSISDAALSDSGGGNLAFTGTSVTSPSGTAIDAVGGVIYWANDGAPGTIGWARLNGPGGLLTTTGAVVDRPRGLAIDPGAKRVYWANSAGGAGGNGSISWAAMNGAGSAGGAELVSGPDVTSPYGVTVDPASGRIFWSNTAGSGPGPGPGSIMSAKLDGSDVRALPILGATVNWPRGLALDPVTDTLYWANSPAGTHSGSISFWNLGSETGGDLVTSAPVDEPRGIAIDPVAQRLYWANSGNDTIAYTRLDAVGSGTLNTAGATVSTPEFPALLVTPAGTGSPQVSGGSSVGAALSCVKGSWAGDLPSAFYFRAPRNVSLQWMLDGSAIPGATTSSYTTTKAGVYTCQELGKNHAGTVAQSSAALVVSGQPAAVTGQGTPTGATAAVLDGTVDPEYAVTSYHFEYGLTTAYGAVVPGTDSTVDADGVMHPVVQTLSGLEPNRTYHYRLVAANVNGSSYGADGTFTTRSTPAVSTGEARAVSDAGATLTGTVNPENLATEYYFQYGPTVTYGSRSPYDNVAAGADRSDHQATQVLSALSASTTYHFRLVAVNAVGVTYGNDLTFTTAARPAGALEPKLTPGRIGTLGAVLHLSLGCTGTGSQRCSLSVSTSVVERLSSDGRRILGVQASAASGRHRSVVVAAQRFALASGARRDVSMRLNATGRMLRARFGRLPATVVVRSGSTGTASRLVKTAKVTFGADPPRLRVLSASALSASGLRLGLACSGSTGQQCSVAVELTTYQRFGANGQTVTGLTSAPTAGSTAVTISRATYRVRAGRTDRRQLRLSDCGRSLLQEFKRVPASLTVLMSYGGYKVTSAHRIVTLRSAPKSSAAAAPPAVSVGCH